MFRSARTWCWWVDQTGGPGKSLTASAGVVVAAVAVEAAASDFVSGNEKVIVA